MATTAADTVTLDKSYAPSLDRRRARYGAGSSLRGRRARVDDALIDSNLIGRIGVPDDVSLVEAPAGSEFATRALNVCVAAIALLVLSPLFVLIALAIKLTSRGPVFYTQTRVGLDRRWRHKGAGSNLRVRDLGGKPFTIYKFRTMVTDAEVNGRAVWASRDDARVTSVGRYLRASRLDELPQFINVLMGHMNVVGPRPERPAIFAELRESIPHYHLRQRVMPGITGWAQINQCYDECLDDVRRKVGLDLEYLEHRSVGQDLAIMARTVPVMIGRNFGW